MTKNHHNLYGLLYQTTVISDKNAVLNIPIESNQGVVIVVNEETRDILFHSFRNSFLHSYGYKEVIFGDGDFSEQVFLVQKGVKTAIFLNYSYIPDSKYISKLESAGINIVQLNIPKNITDLVTATIDLENPSIINIIRLDDEIVEELETTITTIGNKQSTLPDINSIIKDYSYLVTLSKDIIRAKVDYNRLGSFLSFKFNIDQYGEYAELLAEAVEKEFQKEAPFSHNNLYLNRVIDRIVHTLRQIEKSDGGVEFLAFLIKHAAEQTINRLSQNDIHITKHAEELLEFSISYFNKQDDEGKEIFIKIAAEQIVNLHAELSKIKSDLQITLPPKFTPSNEIASNQTSLEGVDR